MAVESIEIGAGLLTIGATSALTDFSEQCVSAKIIPNVTKGERRRVLSGGVTPGSRTEEHKLQVKLLNDFGVANSKTEWLWENRGKEMPFVFVPNSAKTRKVTGTLVVEPIDIGGDVGEKPENQVEFDILGAPNFAAHPGT